MRRWQSLVIAVALAGVGCAGLPPKPKPVQLTSTAPLDGFDVASGGEMPVLPEGHVGCRGG